MRMIKFFLNKYKFYLIGFLFIFLFNVFAAMQVDLSRGYDNTWYWRAYEPFFNGHKVGLGELPIWRGVLFLCICGLLNVFGHGKFTYWILFSSFLHAFVFMSIIPYVFDFSERPSIFFRSFKKMLASVFCFILLFCLYSGLFYYTLSDVFALYMSLLSVFFMKKIIEENSFSSLMFFSFLCAVFAYSSYNSRGIYLFFLALEIIIAFLIILKKSISVHKRLICVCAFVIGILMAGVPQAIFNYKHGLSDGVEKAKISILIPNYFNYAGQIYNGLQWQRVDGYIGRPGVMEQSTPFMESQDLVGRKLFELNGGNGTIKGAIKLIIKYPFEYAGVCMRHFMNMTFPCWPNQYVCELNNNKLPYAIISLLLMYSFILSAILRCLKSLTSYWMLAPVFLVCFMCLPDGREMRYIIGFFFIMAGTLFFNVDYKALALKIKENWIAVLVVFVLFSAVMISQWTWFLMTQETGIPIFILGK
ncbi:MAG: hypothetical protein K5917_00825 [Clostridiales bacterium]|nr:hypothetical protein [Clostridiales bacterium]